MSGLDGICFNLRKPYYRYNILMIMVWGKLLMMENLVNQLAKSD